MTGGFRIIGAAAALAVVATTGADAAAVRSTTVSTSGSSDSQVKYAHGEIPSWAISLFSPEGQDLLYADADSVVRTNTARILSNLQTQQTQTWCGVATAVTALNSLQVERSLARLEPFYYPYAQFTQPTFFSNLCVLNVTSPSAVSAAGLTLDELADMVNCYSPDPEHIQLARGVHAKDEYSNVDEMRSALIGSLERGNERVLMNYQRREFKPHGGHWSPLAAYSKEKDLFLVADVESFLYPPVWLTAEEIYNSVVTIDSTSEKSRGFIFVEGAIVD